MVFVGGDDYLVMATIKGVRIILEKENASVIRLEKKVSQ